MKIKKMKIKKLSLLVSGPLLCLGVNSSLSWADEAPTISSPLNGKIELSGHKEFKGKIGKTFAESKEWWPDKKQAPKGAPNIIYFLIDDAGFGSSSAFGGLMETPTLDSLANDGLRFTNFHT